MFKNRFNYLKKHYKVEPNTKTFIIEVALDDYSDVFNEWDPAPFRRRDMDPDLRQFLEDSSFDIPIKYPLKLCFVIPKEMEDASKEEKARSGLKNNFDFILHLIKREFNETRKRGFLYIFTSFSFLILSSILKTKLSTGIFAGALLEGLFIGGWVFLWEAFTLFFFAGYESYKEWRIFKRLINSKVEFLYKNT